MFFVAMALALAVGTLLIASATSDALVLWLQGLPPRKARLVQPVLGLLAVFLLVLGAYARRKSATDGDS